MSDYVSTSSLTGASHIDNDPEIPVEETEKPLRKTPRILARLFEAVLVLRDFFLLLIGLLLDERVDRKVKIFVGSVIAYIISPIDFIPDLLGGLFGLADDFVLTAFALNVLMNWVDPEIVTSHWRGKKDLLATVQKGIRNAEILVPEAILKKIQAWIGKRAPEGLVPVQVTPATAPAPEQTETTPPKKKRTTRSRKSTQ
ncbi:DUF1232 domain-containing protein [bacterium]|nr:DUF1232 domain-containing protein [bacterium]MCI0615193.1 DUF1232 domain-containing protein [bacterium]